MKRITAAIILCMSAGTLALAAAAKDVSSAEAKAIIDKAKNVFILDVRSEQERSQGYIPGSQLIPIDTIERRLAEVPKNRPIVVYCAVGSRSRAVAQGLSRLGYAEIYNMRDGIMGWYRSGYPIQR
jgi:rhodanese-related sulfurtransferase